MTVRFWQFTNDSSRPLVQVPSTRAVYGSRAFSVPVPIPSGTNYLSTSSLLTFYQFSVLDSRLNSLFTAAHAS